MNIYQQLQKLDLDYGCYKLTQKEAQEKATILIDEYNKKGAEIAKKHGVRFVKLNPKKFSFFK